MSVPVTQDYFTSRELAEIARSRGLTKFPATERGVQLLAKREGWNNLPAPMVRRRSDQTGGRGMEYPMARPTAKSWLKVYGRCANVVVTDNQASDLKIAAACAQARNTLI